jgi:hypothetical protein
MRKPGRRPHEAEGRTQARPAVVLRSVHHPRPEGVEDDVSRQLEQVRFTLHEDPRETPLEDVAHAVVSAVEALSVDAIQLSHAPGEVGPGCLEEKMVVVCHQAVGAAQPAVLLDDGAEGVEEQVLIGVPQKDGRSCVAS